MRKISLALRGVVGLFVAIALMSAGGNVTAAQSSGYACVNEPGLGLFDPSSPKDGVLTLAELQSVAAQFPDNAELQDTVQKAAAQGVTGIQYDGKCAAGQPTATTAAGQPTATTAAGQPTATTAAGQPTATTAAGQPTATGTDTGTGTDGGSGTGTDGGTGTGTDGGSGTGTDGGTGTGTDGGTGTGTDSGTDVTGLPDTGAGQSQTQDQGNSSFLIMFGVFGAVGMLAVGGAFALRQRRQS